LNAKIKANSIKFKTLCYLVVFSISLLLLLWIFQILFLKIAYENYQTNNIKEIVKEIREISYEKLPTVLENVAYDDDICIELIDSFGNKYGYNTKQKGCELGSDNPKINRRIQRFINSNNTSDSVKVINSSLEVKALLYGIKRDNNYIFLYSTLEDIDGASIILKNQLIYITIVAIIFAICISYFLSKKITGPILKITEQAKKLGAGKNDINFEKNGIMEIDELADTLNHVEKDLAKTDELRRDLMANVSHDLKTPLTMIKAYAEMIRDISYKDKTKTQENLDVIIAETDRLNVLVNDILDLSKLQADADHIEKEEYDLVSEVKEIIKRYSIIKETEDYKFNIEMPAKALIKADKNKLNQVIYNLINNAINYTGKDKTVTVKITDNKKSYLIEIIDTGKGIKEEDIPYIWNKYFKNEKNHRRNIVGTGIGLSIVKEILEKHEFKYGVKSKKNEGSNFYFIINK